MLYTAHPVWSYPPTWSSPVVEKLEWRTDVLIGETGAEQRIPRRLTPRRSLRGTFYLVGAYRQRFEHQIAGLGSNIWLIPVWHDVTTLTADAPAGSTTLSIDTRWREYSVGDLLYIRSRVSDTWEVVQIQSLSDSSVTLVSHTDNVWASSSLVYPARLARLEFSMSGNKKTDNFLEIEVNFKLDQSNPYTSDIAFPEFAGSPVLDQRPDDSEDLEFSYERLFETVDNDVGIPAVYDVGGKTFWASVYRWSLKGRQASHELRQLLMYLRGRNRAMWVPTFMNDFTVVQNIPAASSTLSVRNVGYTALGARKPGREDIRIQLRSGVTYYRHITTSMEDSSSQETLTLGTPLPDAFTVDQVRSVSYMQRSRMTEDLLEITHYTDTDGFTQCSARWRGPVDV